MPKISDSDLFDLCSISITGYLSTFFRCMQLAVYDMMENINSFYSMYFPKQSGEILGQFGLSNCRSAGGH